MLTNPEPVTVAVSGSDDDRTNSLGCAEHLSFEGGPGLLRHRSWPPTASRSRRVRGKLEVSGLEAARIGEVAATPQRGASAPA